MLLLSFSSMAEVKVAQVDAEACSQGVHEQPGGVFAIYVFCDDALGTNIAVFLNKMAAPVNQDYTLGSRFWQNQEWAYDVISYAWLPDNKLLISTSAVYGSGAVYLLDLEHKVSKTLAKIDGAVIELMSVTGHQIELRFQTAQGKYEYQTISM